MPITLDQLAPFLTDPRMAQRGAQDAATNYIESLRQQNALAERAREHDASIASSDAQAAAALAEQNRYHTGTLGQGQQQIDAATQERQAAAIAHVIELAGAGKISQAYGMTPSLGAIGVNARREMSQPTPEGAPTPAAMQVGNLWSGQAPGMIPGAPAQEAKPTGVLTFSAGGKDLGQLDIAGMSAEQQQQALRMVQMLEQSSRLQDKAIRAPIAEGLAAIPEMAASPAAFTSTFSSLVNPPAQNLQSGINASMNAQAQRQLHTTNDATTNFKIGSAAYARILDKLETDYDVKGLNLAMRKSKELEDLASGDNPLANQGAMLELVKTMYGGSRIAQQEINNFMKAAGLADLTTNSWNKLFSQGELSRRQMNNVITLARQLGDNAGAMLQTAAEAGANSVMTDTDIGAAAPEWQKSWARSLQQRVLGQAGTGEAMEVPRLGGGGGGTVGTSTSRSARGAAAAPPEVDATDAQRRYQSLIGD